MYSNKNEQKDTAKLLDVTGYLEIRDKRSKIKDLLWKTPYSNEIYQIPLNGSTLSYSYFGESYSVNETTGETIRNEGFVVKDSRYVETMFSADKSKLSDVFNSNNKYRAILENGTVVDFCIKSDKDIPKLLRYIE